MNKLLDEFKKRMILRFKDLDWSGIVNPVPTKLMICDDERSLRLLLLEIFSEENGCIVELFENGQTALKRYPYFQPDIILSDIMMDTMTGIELAYNVLKINPDQKIFFFSGWLNKDKISEKFSSYFQSRQFRFIAKPLDLYDLQNQIYFFYNSNIEHKEIDLLLGFDLLERQFKSLNYYQLGNINEYLCDLTIKVFKDYCNKELSKKDIVEKMLIIDSQNLDKPSLVGDSNVLVDSKSSRSYTEKTLSTGELLSEINIFINYLKKLYEFIKSFS